MSSINQVLTVCSTATKLIVVVGNSKPYFNVTMRELEMLAAHVHEELDISAVFEHHTIMYVVSANCITTQVVPRQTINNHPVSV